MIKHPEELKKIAEENLNKKIKEKTAYYLERIEKVINSSAEDGNFNTLFEIPDNDSYVVTPLINFLKGLGFIVSSIREIEGRIGKCYIPAKYILNIFW